MKKNGSRPVRTITLKSNMLMVVKCQKCDRKVHIGTTTCRVHLYDTFADAVGGQYNTVVQMGQTVACPECGAPLFESTVNMDPEYEPDEVETEADEDEEEEEDE